MRGVVMYAPGDVRVEDRPEPTILKPTDAIIRLSATCICGSDLWPYRGIEPLDGPRADGARVRRHRRGGRRRRSPPSGRASSSSGRSSPPTTPARSAGPATSPPASHREAFGADRRAQAERMRVPLADGTLVATPEVPDADLVPQLPGRLRRARHRLVRRRRRRGRPGQDRRRGRRRRRRAARRPGRQAARRGADHRDEPARAAAAAGAGVRRHRHRHRTRRRRRGRDQGPDRRARRALGDRGRRHPGVDDAGHPLHPARRARRLRRRHPRRRPARRWSCSSPTSTCTAAPPRCAGSCPT